MWFIVSVLTVEVDGKWQLLAGIGPSQQDNALLGGKILGLLRLAGVDPNRTGNFVISCPVYFQLPDINICHS